MAKNKQKQNKTLFISNSSPAGDINSAANSNNSSGLRYNNYVVFFQTIVIIWLQVAPLLSRFGYIRS